MTDKPAIPPTFFASAERASHETLQQEKSSLAASELIATLLNAMPDYLLVLNSNRQIVTVNQRLLEAFGVEHPEALEGLRPGEAIDCIHFKEGPGGCGTAKNCAVCGAVLAILASQESGLPQRRECQLMLDTNGCHALDLDVLATPITVAGESFTVLALRDISSEKRRYVMERVFFHDILNNAGGIRGLASLLQEGVSEGHEQEYKQWMVNLSDNLVEEINHQRRLLQAERGDYKPEMETVNLTEVIYDLLILYQNHDRARGKVLDVDPDCSGTIVTDRALLRRVVGNMILNALEASQFSDQISIWTHCQAERVRISVTNPGEMTPEVQLHLFKRSFSTKSNEGRGLGTYSMKLFGERYLHGTVGFYSNNGMTTFFIELPVQPDKPSIT